MKNLITIIIVLFIIGCTREPLYVSRYIICNNSSHKINYYMYANQGTIVDSLKLSVSEKKEFLEEGIGNPIFPFSGDSLVLYYDDTLRTTHYPGNNQTVSRSLLNISSWEKNEIEKNKYIYKYIFTNDDYQEALDSQ